MPFCCCKDEIQRVTTTLTSMNIRCLTKSCRSSVPYMSPPNYKLWVSPFIEGQTAKTFYDILCRWRGKSCGRATQRLSRHDNTSAHNALSIQQFLAEQNLVMLDQTSDSPDLDQPPFYQVQGSHQWNFFWRWLWWQSWGGFWTNPSRTAWRPGTENWEYVQRGCFNETRSMDFK